ncbi:MAG: hypothetical protein AB1634_03205 [Thermodesulfobacteriota bacterium]
MRILETLICHGGDRLDWLDVTGRSGPDTAAPVRVPLAVAFDALPPGIFVVHKLGATVLLPGERLGGARIVPGAASEADLVPPAVAGFSVTGTVRDPANRFLPRRFVATLGGGQGHAVGLFRSALGTRLPAAGAAVGSCRFVDGSLASWAVLSLAVTVLVGPAIRLVAQADGRGEFVIPLSRLPLLAAGAPQADYEARLQVLASPAVSGRELADPDSLTPVRVRSPAANVLSFAPGFRLQPGRITVLTSKNRSCLEVRVP